MRAAFLLVLLSALTNGGSALINLFISKHETNRTLGVMAEMAYIKDGVVNTYALRFPYRIATNISKLTFSWNSTASEEINYSIQLIADNPAVLPMLDVPRTGRVPRRTETFVVEYRCAGNKAGQFGVVLHANFSSSADANPIHVSLRQDKLCSFQEVARGIPGPVEDSSASVGGDGANQQTAGATITADQVFYIAIGCVFAVVIIIGSLIVAYFKSAKKGLAQDIGRESLRYPVPHSSPGYVSQTQPFLRTDSPSTTSKYSAITGGQSASSALAPATGACRAAPTPSSSITLTPPVIILDQVVAIDTQAALNDLRADRNCFELGQIELEGTFGEVRWAFWRLAGQVDMGDVDEEEDQAGGEVPMIVKTLKPTAEPGQYDKFIAEALVFYGLPPHQNIAQVEAAACFGRFARSDPLIDAPLICYVHTGFGNLKKFLLRCRGESSGPGPNALRTQDLVSMGLQIVKGMVHLHRLGVLHKDIATRNCLISEDFTVQLSDTALSRDLFPNDYHCLGDNENRPVKWLALEALDKCQFTSASDVWAFGVTMWELLSLAQQPYADIDPDEISSSLQDGIRLPQPYNCPDELFGVMYCCWHHHYTARPSFEQLMVALEDFLTQLMQFI